LQVTVKLTDSIDHDVGDFGAMVQLVMRGGGGGGAAAEPAR